MARAPRIELFLRLLEIVEQLVEEAREAGLGSIHEKKVGDLQKVCKQHASEAALVWYREYRTYSVAIEKHQGE